MLHPAVSCMALVGTLLHPAYRGSTHRRNVASSHDSVSMVWLYCSPSWGGRGGSLILAQIFIPAYRRGRGKTAPCVQNILWFYLHPNVRQAASLEDKRWLLYLSLWCSLHTNLHRPTSLEDNRWLLCFSLCFSLHHNLREPASLQDKRWPLCFSLWFSLHTSSRKPGLTGR